MANSTKPNIANFPWLAMGVVLGLIFLAKLQGRPGSPMSPGMWLYMLVGLLVACVWAVFENPKSVENGWHIAVLIPITSAFWPFLLLFLLTNKPWTTSKWKSRHEIIDPNPSDTSETGNPQ